MFPALPSVCSSTCSGWIHPCTAGPPWISGQQLSPGLVAFFYPFSLCDCTAQHSPCFRFKSVMIRVISVANWMAKVCSLRLGWIMPWTNLKIFCNELHPSSLCSSCRLGRVCLLFTPYHPWVPFSNGASGSHYDTSKDTQNCLAILRLDQIKPKHFLYNFSGLVPQFWSCTALQEHKETTETQGGWKSKDNLRV